MKFSLRHKRIAIVLVFALALVSLPLAGCTQTENPGVLAAGSAPEASQVAVQAQSIPIEIVTVSDAHPGDDINVTIKTNPGAEVSILFISPSGSKSAYPKDNTKVAGTDGTITWQWNINSHVPAGEATLTFTPTGGTEDSIITLKKKI